MPTRVAKARSWAIDFIGFTCKGRLNSFVSDGLFSLEKYMDKMCIIITLNFNFLFFNRIK
ncbi:hypothetical protein TW91_0689 [Neisseria flavescens]|nr:hypothetical protein TW91_0689 [Neisseria flavescens]